MRTYSRSCLSETVSIPETKIQMPSCEKPDVSVLIPYCNGPMGLLRTAIATCLEQTHVSLEVLVLDDGSDPPLSLEDITLDSSNRVGLITLPYNRGTGYARRTLASLARGTYARFLDQDDRLLPNILSRQVADIGDGDVLFGRYSMEGNPKQTTAWDEQLAKLWDGNPTLLPESLLIHSNNYLGPNSEFWRVGSYEVVLGDETSLAEDMVRHRHILMSVPPENLRWTDAYTADYYAGSPTSSLNLNGYAAIYGRAQALVYQKWYEARKELGRNLKVAHIGYGMYVGGRDWATSEFLRHGHHVGIDSIGLFSDRTEMSDWAKANGASIRIRPDGVDYTEWLQEQLVEFNPDAVVSAVEEYSGSAGVLFEGSWKKFLYGLGALLPSWAHDPRVSLLDGVVCVTDATRELCPLFMRKGKVILNAVNVEDFRAGKYWRNPIRKDLDIPEDASVVIWIGRAAPVKRQDLAIEVIHKVLNANPDAYAIVVSQEDPLWDGLNHDRIRFVTDALPWDSFKLHAASDVYLSTADFEGLPVVQLEAMASGHPVVIPNAFGGQAEVVQGEVGRVVARGDIDGLAEGVLYYMQHPELGRAAKHYCIARCHIIHNLRMQFLVYTGNHHPKMHWADYEV